MAKNEKTSPAVASIAARALRDPSDVTKKEVQKLAASVLTQTADQPKAKAPAKPKAKPRTKK